MAPISSHILTHSPSDPRYSCLFPEHRELQRGEGGRTTHDERGRKCQAGCDDHPLCVSVQQQDETHRHPWQYYMHYGLHLVLLR